MHPLAHHTGEDSLAPLLLAGSAWLSLALTITRSRLTTIHAKLTGKRGAHRRAPGR